jgi:hypothetical protein
MPSFYDPSDKVFTFELKVKDGDEGLIERHSFSWPASDEGQLEFAAILESTKSPKIKLSNLKGRTRSQNYRDPADNRIKAAFQVWYDKDRPKEFVFTEQNKDANSIDGDAAYQKFYPNGNVEEISFAKHRSGYHVNGPNGEPATTCGYENGQIKEIVYRDPDSGRQINGPNDEPGYQKYFEDGKPNYLESFNYDEKYNRINREDGLPAIREYNDQGKCIGEFYFKGNGPEGYKEIKRDNDGQIILLSYHNEEGEPITITDRKQMALLGVGEDKKIRVSQKFLVEKTGIVMLPAAGDSKNLIALDPKAPVKTLQEHYTP